MSKVKTWLHHLVLCTLRSDGLHENKEAYTVNQKAVLFASCLLCASRFHARLQHWRTDYQLLVASLLSGEFNPIYWSCLSRGATAITNNGFGMTSHTKSVCQDVCSADCVHELASFSTMTSPCRSVFLHVSLGPTDGFRLLSVITNDAVGTTVCDTQGMVFDDALCNL